ncbi:hypothetical protein KIPB_003079, partial [Kipferlia bialata]|eukprot:g3079.t1
MMPGSVGVDMRMALVSPDVNKTSIGAIIPALKHVLSLSTNHALSQEETQAAAKELTVTLLQSVLRGSAKVCVRSADLLKRLIHGERVRTEAGKSRTGSLISNQFHNILFYGPALLMAHTAVNPMIRARCAMLLCEAYPIIPLAEVPTPVSLVKQTSMVLTLMQDSAAKVRAVMAGGIGRPLSLFWDSLDNGKQKVLKQLVTTLTVDRSSAPVRRLSLDSITTLLGNPLSRELTKTHLMAVKSTVMATALQDRSPEVSMAYVRLLEEYSKGYSLGELVSVNDLLSCLYENRRNSELRKALVALLIPGLVYDKTADGKKFKSSSRLVKSICKYGLIHPEGARVLLASVSEALPPEQCAQMAGSLLNAALMAGEHLNGVFEPVQPKKKGRKSKRGKEGREEEVIPVARRTRETGRNSKRVCGLNELPLLLTVPVGVLDNLYETVVETRALVAAEAERREAEEEEETTRSGRLKRKGRKNRDLMEESHVTTSSEELYQNLQSQLEDCVYLEVVHGDVTKTCPEAIKQTLSLLVHCDPEVSREGASTLKYLTKDLAHMHRICTPTIHTFLAFIDGDSSDSGLESIRACVQAILRHGRGTHLLEALVEVIMDTCLGTELENNSQTEYFVSETEFPIHHRSSPHKMDLFVTACIALLEMCDMHRDTLSAQGLHKKKPVKYVYLFNTLENLGQVIEDLLLDMASVHDRVSDVQTHPETPAVLLAMLSVCHMHLVTMLCQWKPREAERKTRKQK